MGWVHCCSSGHPEHTRTHSPTAHAAPAVAACYCSQPKSTGRGRVRWRCSGSFEIGKRLHAAKAPRPPRHMRPGTPAPKHLTPREHWLLLPAAPHGAPCCAPWRSQLAGAVPAVSVECLPPCTHSTGSKSSAKKQPPAGSVPLGHTTQPRLGRRGRSLVCARSGAAAKRHWGADCWGAWMPHRQRAGGRAGASCGPGRLNETHIQQPWWRCCCKGGLQTQGPRDRDCLPTHNQ
jgi:hypothetical protein